MIKKQLFSLILMLLLVFTCLIGYAQNLPYVIEVEDGIVGSDFQVLQDGDVEYITITTNGTADYPESESRIVTLDISFGFSQPYDLYVRCRVGSEGANDDSFFYGSTFGSHSPTDGSLWTRVNNITTVGYTIDEQYVDGNGAAGTQVWKWINLSEFTGDETPVVFDVNPGDLNQVIEIGAREDGLDIDKIAFARSDYFFTVSNLDNMEAGSPDMNGGNGNDSDPIADGKPKFLGNIYSGSQRPGFENYWNQVTPENAGKWGSVEAQRDVMNWQQLDSAYALAKDNDFPFRFHVLVWGNQQPAWIENLSASEQLAEIEEWFEAVSTRYPDIDMIEVVNEPIHDPPNQSGQGGGNYIEALGGTGSTGYDWIITAFTMARQYFPNAELAINEYNIVNSFNNANTYLDIIELLQDQGLIDQIGVQAHAFSTRGSTTQMSDILDMLAETGLPLFVTELDIDGPTDQEQLEDYQRIFPVFWEHPAVEGITLWGYRVGMWRTDQMAYLVDEDGQTERPALEWLREYVESTFVSTFEPGHRDESLTVYPNPVVGSVITLDGETSYSHYEIYNASGYLINIGDISGWPVQISLNMSNTGIYFLKLSNTRTTHTEMILIQPDE